MERKVFCILLLACFTVLHSFAQGARIQFIHNAADTALEGVDIWMDNTQIETNIGFREASGFVTVPSGPHWIYVYPSGVADSNSILFSDSIFLPSGSKTQMIMAGSLDTTGFTPPVPLHFQMVPNARLGSAVPGNVDFRFVAGATDAPALDFYETHILQSNLATDLEYGEITPYREEFADDFRFRLATSGNNNIFKEYEADFASQGFEGEAMLVISSGFVQPLANKGGWPFGLYLVLAEGGNFIPLSITTGTLQAFNVAEAPGLQNLDIYIDSQLVISDLSTFFSSQPLEIASGTEHAVHLVPGGSSSLTDAVFDTVLAVQADERYSLIVAGPSENQPQVRIMKEGLFNPNASGGVAYRFLHVSSEVGPVDIVETTFGTINHTGFALGESTPWNEVPPALYRFNVVANGSDTAVVPIDFQHAAIHGKAVTFFLSGSLDTLSGHPFRIYAANFEGGPMAGFSPEEAPVGIIDAVPGKLKIYPNPVKSIARLNMGVASIVTIEVYSLKGQRVLITHGAADSVDLSALPSGFYTLVATTSTGAFHAPLVKQ